MFYAFLDRCMPFEQFKIRYTSDFENVPYLQDLATKLVHRPTGGERSGQYDRQATSACDKPGDQPAPLHPLKAAIQYSKVKRQIEEENSLTLILKQCVVYILFFN